MPGCHDELPMVLPWQNGCSLERGDRRAPPGLPTFTTILLAVKIAVPKETLPGERRVALVPDVAGKLAGAGIDVTVGSGAGDEAGFGDDAYVQAGASVEFDRTSLLGGADVLLKVQPPAPEEVGLLKAGAVTISFLQPATQGPIVEALAKRGVTAFSLELVPRISRAQSM